MKRLLFSTMIILSLLFSLSGPIHQAQASNMLAIPDSDQDGLSNVMETNGWYNLAGGPYITNPNEADTDHDGLTDAQEKLFNTDPTDPNSPGLAVKYEKSYQTFEYYSAKDPAYLAMVQGGSQYLLTEGAVIRRGTTFNIATVNSETATLTVSGAGLTSITPVRDITRGGWNVTVPINGTVGTYTATITNGAWSKSMPVYVIFELPTDMTQAQIDAYLYDDNPANQRDEVAVWWRAVDWKYYNSDSETPTPCNPTDPICSAWQYHTISGYAQAFWTEQFTKNVLVNFTLPAMNGSTSLYSAAQAIGEKADASVRVNFASVKNSFSSATKVYYYPDDPLHPLTPYRTDGGGCETSAGVLTAMLRSAGIPAQTFALDYNKTAGHGENGNFGVYEYDHGVRMWLQGPGVATNRWYAERSFNGAEDEYQSTPIWASGTTGLRLLADVGSTTNLFKHFQDVYSDAIQSANEGWDFQNGSAGGGMVNTAWTGSDVPGTEFAFQNRDFKWNSKYPLQIQQSPFVDILNCQLWKGDGWAPSEWYAASDPLYLSNPAGRTAQQTYYLPIGMGTPGDIENWPYNPKPTSCSDSTSPGACTAFQNSWQAACAALPGQTVASAQSTRLQPVQPAVSTLNTSMHLGNILSSAGVDQNGDGRFDQLVVKFNLSSSQAGQYQLGGWLRAGDQEIRADVSRVNLIAGSQTQQITFDGQQIGDHKINGPYQVEAIWVAPASQAVSEQALPEEMAAYQTYSYMSQPYQANAFTVQAASISGGYSYTGSDTNHNGRVDSIHISVPLNIAIPGTFNVEGDLYDGQGAFVGHATWTGNGPTVSLKYTVAGTMPPYSLEHLNLVDARGKALGSFYAPVYTIGDLGGKIDQGHVSLISNPAGASPQTVTPTNLFSVNPVDSNANGLYNQLVASTTVDVTGQGGSYWMEGLLIDDQNTPVAWASGNPQTLDVGTGQTLQMTFDGQMLFDHLPLAGTRKFTLVAVKIFSGTPGQATLEADVPVTGFTTPAYSRGQFEPSVPGSTLFQDDMESGTAKWNITASSQWSQTNNEWHSWSHAWIANGSVSQDGVLSFGAPFDFTPYANPWLRFNTSYQLAAGQSIDLEISTDGILWNTVRTYVGSTANWSAQMVDLSAYGKTSGVMLRFNAQSNPGSIWYIDDIFINAAPDVINHSYYLPILIGH